MGVELAACRCIEQPVLSYIRVRMHFFSELLVPHEGKGMPYASSLDQTPSPHPCHRCTSTSPSSQICGIKRLRCRQTVNFCCIYDALHPEDANKHQTMSASRDRSGISLPRDAEVTAPAPSPISAQCEHLLLFRFEAWIINQFSPPPRSIWYHMLSTNIQYGAPPAPCLISSVSSKRSW